MMMTMTGSGSVGEMFSTSTQRKYWTFHEQAELDQLREEVNHQYVAKNGGGDMDADVCVRIVCDILVKLSFVYKLYLLVVKNFTFNGHCVILHG